MIPVHFGFTTDEAAEELNKILLLMLGCAVQVSNRINPIHALTCNM